MKKWKLILLLLTFNGLLVSNLQAQVIPDVTPNNIGSVVDEIFNYHGTQINLTYNEVYDFVEDLILLHGYDPNTSAPSAELINVTTNSLSFVWDAAPDLYGYQASFLELTPPSGSSPETGSVLVTVPQVQFNVSNGLILTAFQSKQAPGLVSRVEIIIVEKPVFFENATADCKCKDSGVPISHNFGPQEPNNGNESVIFEYSHQPASVGYYNMSVDFGDGTFSDIIVIITISGDKIEVGIVCQTNSFIDKEIVYTGETEGEILGSLSFAGGIGFTSANASSGTVSLVECNPTTRPGINPRNKARIENSNKNIVLKAMPNPAKDRLTILIPEHLKIEGQSLFLIDAVGNQFALPPSRYYTEQGALKLEIDHIPSGIYSLQFQNKDIAMKTRFVKIE